MSSTGDRRVESPPDVGTKLHVEVNNLVVQLVRYGWYLDALRGITICINLMKNMRRIPHCPGVGDEDDSVRAHRWMVQAEANVLLGHHSSPSSIVPIAITSDYNPGAIYPNLAIGTSHNSVTFPMMISTIDSEIVAEARRDEDFHACIVLYNLGVVLDCLAVISGPPHMDMLHRTSLAAFQLANRALSALFNWNLQPSGTHDMHVLNVLTIGRLLQFQAYMSHTMIRKCRHLSMSDVYSIRQLVAALRLIDAQEGVIRTTVNDYARAA